MPDTDPVRSPIGSLPAAPKCRSVAADAVYGDANGRTDLPLGVTLICRRIAGGVRPQRALGVCVGLREIGAATRPSGTYLIDMGAHTDDDGSVRIRRFRLADAPHVWALNAIPNIGSTADPEAPLDLPVPPEPPATFPDMADIPRTFIDAGGDFLVGELHGHLVAMGGISPNSARQAEVRYIRVHPAMRRRSFGRNLMTALEARAVELGFTELHLDTATNQPEAIAFYRSLGYEEVGRETRPEWAWTLVYFVKTLDQ